MRVEFTGGLEALALQDYQVELLAGLRPCPPMFFAYDPGDAFETLEHAARRLREAGFPPRSPALPREHGEHGLDVVPGAGQ